MSLARMAILSFAVLLCLAAPAGAAIERPIVYAVVLDGLDGDKIDEGKAPFIASLLAGRDARSTYYRESRSVMIAETNPNHTSMVTGAYPGQSGIPGNAFALYQPLAGEDTCRTTGPENLTKLPSITSGEQSSCPTAESVFGAIKRNGNPDGLRTAAIFGKPKLGRLFAAQGADFLWAPCTSEPDDDAYCGRVPLNPATGYADNDKTVMDVVLRSMGEGPRRPDFTFVNLHQIDTVGHATGTGAGYDEGIAMADVEVQRLVDELKKRGEWQRTVLVLLSDHAMDTTLTKTTLASRFERAGVPEDQTLVVQNGSVDMVYLADRTSPGRFEVLKKLRAAALADPAVGEALYREANPADGGAANTLDAVHPAWKLAGPRTGDLVVTTKPGAAFSDPSSTSNPIPGNHGGPQTRDNFFAVVSGGGGVKQQAVGGTAGPLFDDTLTNERSSENVDLAPTVMALLGGQAPKDNAGRFLDEAFDLGALPGNGRAGSKPTLQIKRLDRRPRRGVTRYELTFGPEGGRYDLKVRKGRKLTSPLVNTAQRTYTLRARKGKRYRVAAALRSAAGVPGEATTRTIGR